MKKAVSMLLAMIMIVACLCLSSNAAGPGSTTTTAMPIELGRTYSGTIGSGQDKYFYKYTLPSSGCLNISFYSTDINKVCLENYDSSTNNVFYQYIYQNDVSGIMNENIRVNVIGGTYYLCVEREYYNGNYTFSVDVNLANESFPESLSRQDNTTTKANQITFGTMYTGHLACNDEIDYYKLVVPSAMTVPFHINSNSLQRVYVNTYDSGSNYLWSTVLEYNENSGLMVYDNNLSFSSPGTYYIAFEKYSWSFPYTGAYSFSLGDLAPAICTVTFNGNGGTVSPSSRTVDAGTTITLPAASRSGYTFLGWSEFGYAPVPTYYAGNTITVNEDLTLYAVWQKTDPSVQFTVTLDPNGGSVYGSTAYTVSPGELIKLPSATRDGYDFVGWSETIDGVENTYAPETSYALTHNAVLRAKWEQQPTNVFQVFFQRLRTLFAILLDFFRRLFGIPD